MAYTIGAGVRYERTKQGCGLELEVREGLRADLERRSGRAPSRAQLDGHVATWLWVIGCVREAKRRGERGTTFRRSIPQAIRGVARYVDWRPCGVVAIDRERYRNQLIRRCRALMELGYLERLELVFDHHGEHAGVRFYVPAGVAARIPCPPLPRPPRGPHGTAPGGFKATPRRGAPGGQPGRPSALLSPPPGAPRRGVALKPLTRDGLGRARASAREGAPLHGPPNGGLSDARRRRAGAGGGAALERFPAWLDAIAAACSASDRAALERLRRRLVREPGRDAARWAVAGAVRDGASVTVVALACWWLATGGREPRLSAAGRAQLERSAAQFDRLNGRRAAARWLFDHLDNHWRDDRDHREQFGRPIESLGFYVRWLKWEARHQRRGRRKRPTAPWQSRHPDRVVGW